MSEEKMRTLVLCVDRDNDIGVKTSIKTPIIGRENNIQAASKLALVDPEESDANAIFGAVKTYDSLSDEGIQECEIATIVGSESGGVRADKQLREELLKVIKLFPPNNVILVTDGFSDEEILPIIQSHSQILSIRRIVVKHSERIEESWAIFWRYLTKLVEDPYYARWALGAPGVLLISLAILWYFGREYVGIVFLVFTGSLAIIKGFSIDKKIGEWVYPNPPNLIRLFTTVTALIIIGLDSYQTYISLFDVIPGSFTENIPLLIGWIMYFATNLIVVASILFLVGIAIYQYFMRDNRIWWNIVGIVVMVWMRLVALKASEILVSPRIPPSSVQDLIIVVVLGIITTIIMIRVTFNLSKKFEHYFNEV